MRKVQGYTITENGQIIGLRGKPLKGTLSSKGHLFTHTNRRIIYFHVLIAKAYPEICGEWFEGAVVHHIDRNKLNNDPHNLKVMTKEEHDRLHAPDKGFCKGNKPWNKDKSDCFTEESKKKMSESAKRRGATNTKAVLQLKDGIVIKRWDNALMAYEALGISNKDISACCHNKQKSAGGYEWKFE